MENLTILAGILMLLRGYWVFNLLKLEKGEDKRSFLKFLEDKNLMAYCILVRPFYRKKKDESLRKGVNILTYLIYISATVGIYYILKD